MNKLLKRISDNYKKISIYGAGLWATRLYYYLLDNNLDDRIQCFVVTSAKGNKESLSGVPVCDYASVKNNLIDTHVMIAMSRTVADEIRTILETDGIENEIVDTKSLDSEIKDFYWEKYKGLNIQTNKIFVDCYQGAGYKCNCKYLIEKIWSKKKNIDIVWDVNQQNENSKFPDFIRVVKRFSPEYYQELYSAKVIIANDDMVSNIKKKEYQLFVNTWHGTGPFKKVNAALYPNDEEKKRILKDRYNRVDLFISNSSDNTQMFRDSFLYDGEIYEAGSPRNDVLINDNLDKKTIMNSLGIDANSKILLYAPTFRDNVATSFEHYDLDIFKILDALSNRFGGKFVLLYRFHHQLYKFERCKNFYKDGINVTLYEDVQELLAITDVLITDYSSIMWDFSLMRRPVFLYQNDEKEYMNDRGFYCPVSQWPYIIAHSSEELCNKIRNFDDEDYLESLERFFSTYKSYDDGNAAEKVSQYIINYINKK